MKRFFTFLLGVGALLIGTFSAYADNAELISAKALVENELQIKAQTARNNAADFTLIPPPQ